jgi:hypothetical protein
MHHERLRLSLFACVWTDLGFMETLRQFCVLAEVRLVYDIEIVERARLPVSVLRRFLGENLSSPV